mmetsp:Transcript_25649/g.22668  ORF Transcript_25649/g.22668 Transcript_25649/m.22668 type:complete len:88 (+) Transcript_25649:441-704(+)
MDETIGPNKIFKQIAEGLAEKGVATIRYYKRTKKYPAKVAAEKELNLDIEVTEDVLSAVKLAAEHPKIGKIFVMGHSLGAMMAPRIA